MNNQQQLDLNTLTDEQLNQFILTNTVNKHVVEHNISVAIQLLLQRTQQKMEQKNFNLPQLKKIVIPALKKINGEVNNNPVTKDLTATKE